MNLLTGRLSRNIAGLDWAGAIGIMLLGSALVFAVLLTTPQVQRQRLLEQESALLTPQLVPHTATVQRPAASPETQMATYRASLPQQRELNGLQETLHALADEHHLSLKNGEYRAIALPGGLGRLQISFTTDGSYGDLRRFMHQAALALPSLALGPCTLSRQRIADPTLNAVLEFQILYASE